MPKKPSISKSSVIKKQSVAPSIKPKAASGMVDGSWPYNFPKTRTVVNDIGYNNDFHKNVTQSDNDVIISRARNLYHNLGAVYNCIQEQAEFALGEGWNAEFAGTDIEFGNVAQEWLNNNWYEIADVRGQPWTFKRDLKVAVISAIRDGDCLAILSSDASGLFPRIQWIEGHNIGCRFNKPIEKGPFKNYPCFNGVIYNKVGGVIGYNILGPKDDGSEDQQVSIVDCQLVYDPSSFSQGRGLSGIAAGIPDLDHYKTIKEFELAAIKAQGDKTIAVTLPIEEYHAPGEFGEGVVTGSVSASGIQREVLQGGQTVMLKAGSGAKFENLSGNRPGPSTQQFLVEHCLENGFQALRWPLASFSMTKTAPTKLAVIRAQRRVNEIQSGIVYPIWKRLITYAVAKAIKSGILPYSDDFYKWTPSYPKNIIFDAYKDTRQDIEMYNRGWSTGTQIAAGNGYNLKENLRQKAQELKWRNEIAEEFGVNPAELIMLTPNGNAVGTEQDQSSVQQALPAQ